MVKLERLGKLDGHHHDVCSCDFSPDGALLATASYDTRVIVWDPYTCTKLLELWYTNFLCNARRRNLRLRLKLGSASKVLMLIYLSLGTCIRHRHPSMLEVQMDLT